MRSGHNQVMNETGSMLLIKKGQFYARMEIFKMIVNRVDTHLQL